MTVPPSAESAVAKLVDIPGGIPKRWKLAGWARSAGVSNAVMATSAMHAVGEQGRLMFDGHMFSSVQFAGPAPRFGRTEFAPVHAPIVRAGNRFPRAFTSVEGSGVLRA